MGQPETLIFLSENLSEKAAQCMQVDTNIHKEYHEPDSEKLQILLDFRSKDLTCLSLLNPACSLVHVTCINVNYNRIAQLPEKIWQSLPFLKHFEANGNELSNLPDDFGELTYLEEVHLCENNLVSLPESLCKLTKLKVLKLNANTLKRLHSEIGQNVSLEILSIDENKLTLFPATLGLLRNLRVLEANCNRLDYLPSTLNYLENLRVIDLSDNRLTHIPESFGNLTHVTCVDFSKNKIRHLCQHFKSSKVLQRLYLDLNMFIKCPSWFADLEQVVEIRMICNELSELALPEGFGLKSKHLKILDLRGNCMQELPRSFGHLLSLESLLLGTAHSYFERKSHFLNGNWFSILPHNFIELISLTKLFLDDNQLRTLPEDIGNLTHLEDLFLGSNLIFELPMSFTKLMALKRCQLSKNRLVSLPEDIGELNLLTELHLDFNKLRKLPESMEKLTNLEFLDVSENKLKQFPSSFISSLVKLKMLYLDGNKFDPRDCEIPKNIRTAHYGRQDPENSSTNWQDPHKRLEIPHSGVVTTSKQGPSDDETRQVAEECIGSRVFLSEDSEEEEAWDEEISKLSISSCSDISQSQPDIEENWDLDSAVNNKQTDHEAGQFDLDNEEPRSHIFIPSVVRFHSYENHVNFIQRRHCSTQFLSHQLCKPSVVAGQFDSDASDSDDIETNLNNDSIKDNEL